VRPMRDIFSDPQSSWTAHSCNCNDIVISSRIRLARNLEHYSFPQNLGKSKAMEIRDMVTLALKNSTEVEDFQVLNLENLEAIDRQVLMEKHLISPAMTQGEAGTALAVNGDESVAVMINEEDHLRIQCFYPGLQLKAAWQKADAVDDLLERKLLYAYDEKIGYLTACPTNIGTGLRASVMVHLPALALQGSLNEVLTMLGKLGLAVRGLYGEGSEAWGNFFQISNQATLGKSEEQILLHLQQVVEQVTTLELRARELLQKENSMMLEDYIWRSYGVLSYARNMSTPEAMELLSRLRLGVSLHVIGNVDCCLLNQLLVAIQPAFLQRSQKRQLTPLDRDAERARVIRLALSQGSLHMPEDRE